MTHNGTIVISIIIIFITSSQGWCWALSYGLYANDWNAWGTIFCSIWIEGSYQKILQQRSKEPENKKVWYDERSECELLTVHD